jgi:hypothetical protein
MKRNEHWSRDDKGRKYGHQKDDVSRPPPFSPAFLRTVQKGNDEDEINDDTNNVATAPTTSHPLTQQAGRVQGQAESLPIDPDRIEYVYVDEFHQERTTDSSDATRTPPAFNPDYFNGHTNNRVPSGMGVQSEGPERTTPAASAGRSWENTSTSSSGSYDTNPNQRRSSYSSSNAPEPIFGRRQSSSSSSSSSWNEVYAKLKTMTVDGVRNMKAFEEEHQVRARTKRASIQSCRAVKRATVLTAGKVKEWNERHELTTKTKRHMQRSASFLKEKWKRR